MKILLGGILFFCISLQAIAQEKEEVILNPSALPEAALKLAWDDARRFSRRVEPFRMEFVRYIWVPDKDPLKGKLLNYTVNLTLSRSDVIRELDSVAGGALYRLDLYSWSPREKDLLEIVPLYEKLGEEEPYFHVQINAIEFVEKFVPGKIRLTTDSHIYFDGKPLSRIHRGDEFEFFETTLSDDGSTWFNLGRDRFVWTKHAEILVQVIKAKELNNIGRAPNPALDPPFVPEGKSLTELEEFLNTSVPIVRWDWFIGMMTQTLGGGLYYEAIGVQGEKSVDANGNPVFKGKDGKTALELTFAKWGVDEEKVKQLRSDQRAAMLESQVTGKPRRIDVFRGLAGSQGTGLVTVTHDPSDEQLKDEDSDPFLNLLEFKDAGLEVFVERNNGLLFMLAVRADTGNIVASVPDNIATDNRIPNPYTQRLQPPISCIRCHGVADFEDGYKSFDNEVPALLAQRLDVFDDLDSKGRTRLERLETLARLYEGDMRKGDMSKRIRRGREDYADAIFLSTGGMSVLEVSSLMAKTHENYFYTRVDLGQACRELGFIVKEEAKLKEAFDILVPIQPVDPATGVRLEDGRIGILRANKSLNRQQFEKVFGDLYLRMARAARVEVE